MTNTEKESCFISSICTKTNSITIHYAIIISIIIITISIFIVLIINLMNILNKNFCYYFKYFYYLCTRIPLK